MLSRLLIVVCLGAFTLGPLSLMSGCVRREVVVEHDRGWYRDHPDREWHDGDWHDRDSRNSDWHEHNYHRY